MCADFSFSEDDLEVPVIEPETPEALKVYSQVTDDVELEGELHLRQGIEFSGSFKGKIYSNSIVHVAKNGRVSGDIDAYTVSVEGDLRSSHLIARKKLELLAGGKFIGTLDAQPEIIVLSEQATFGKNEDAAREFADRFSEQKTDPTT
ncbi:MAG: bactofilin family protein [bacterium]